MQTIEQGVPSEDLAAFRRCLGQFGTGVTVVTTRSGDELAAMTSNSFASVSLEPALILWSIRKASSSFKLFEDCTHFAVNILARDQAELSQKFAKSGPDKFNDVNWSPGRGGAPLLDGAVATLECRFVQSHDGGDHLIMIGEVEAFTRRGDREALLFVQGRYAMPVDLPQAENLLASSPKTASLGLEVESLSSLLVRAYTAVSPTLATARKMENLNLMEARLMRGIRTFPNRTLAELIPHLLLAVNASEEVLADLVKRGLVVVDEKGGMLLTPEGESCFVAVLSHAKKLEDHELEGIPATEVAVTRRVLSELIRRNRLV